MRAEADFCFRMLVKGKQRATGHHEAGKEGAMSESRAVALARSHLEAWTNHDFDKARGELGQGRAVLQPGRESGGNRRIHGRAPRPRSIRKAGSTWQPASDRRHGRRAKRIDHV